MSGTTIAMLIAYGILFGGGSAVLLRASLKILEVLAVKSLAGYVVLTSCACSHISQLLRLLLPSTYSNH